MNVAIHSPSSEANDPTGSTQGTGLTSSVVGERTMQEDSGHHFFVVDALSTYNVILERPAINAL